MSRNICIIDDEIPADNYPVFINERTRVDQSILKYLIKYHSEWQSDPLKNLIQDIFQNHDDWVVSAFTHPNFYFNYTEENIFSPDIIIFDWDYDISIDTEKVLLRILNSTYAVIAIYTGADKKDEIENILAKDEFKSHAEYRIHLIEKGEDNSVGKVIKDASDRFDNNFSFKLGKELKKNAVSAVESILVSISKMSFDDFVWTFGSSDDKEDKERHLTIKEFIEILSEKFKNELSEQRFSEDKYDSNSKPATDDVEIVRKLWSYRMFYKPTDNIIRTGDIIKKDDDGDARYLVISSDCHLRQFWPKNFGSVTMVPLLATTTDKRLKDKLNLSKSRGNIKGKLASSITNWRAFPDSSSIIAGVPIIHDADGKEILIDYALFPRSVFSMDIPPPYQDPGVYRKLALTYDHLENFSGDNRVNINEPFRSPLIQFVLSAITGFGAPDYPAELQNSINSKLDEYLKQE
jgi:hypothetical protein